MLYTRYRTHLDFVTENLDVQSYITKCFEAFGQENPSETKAEGKTNE